MGGEMGLRERKRLAAMRRIQGVALDLFDQHGYQQVPIERIAEAAEVSPSSIYRYFGTKEQIVLWDEYDPVAIQRIGEVLADQPLMEAVRQVLDETIHQMVRIDEDRVRRRLHYLMREPAIAAASAVFAHQMATLLTTRLADGLGRDHDDLDIHLLAHGFVGAMSGAIRHWYLTGFQTPLPEVINRVVTCFEQGFHIDSRRDPEP